HMGFGLTHAVLTVVENARGQYCIRVALQNARDQMVQISDPAAGDYRNLQSIRECARKLEIEAVAGTIPIHTGEQYFARAQCLRTSPPLESVEPRRLPTPVGKDLPAWVRPIVDTLGIDGYDDALRSYSSARLCHQVRVLDCCGVDTHLVGAGIEQPSFFLNGAPAT